MDQGKPFKKVASAIGAGAREFQTWGAAQTNILRLQIVQFVEGQGRRTVTMEPKKERKNVMKLEKKMQAEAYRGWQDVVRSFQFSLKQNKRKDLEDFNF